MGMIVGAVFVGIGLLVAIPFLGPFGVFWTLIAAAITVFHAINLFSDRGIATTEIDIDEANLINPPQAAEVPFDERIRRLEQLRKDGLISEQEYRDKRREVMGDQW